MSATVENIYFDIMPSWILIEIYCMWDLEKKIKWKKLRIRKNGNLNLKVSKHSEL